MPTPASLTGAVVAVLVAASASTTLWHPADVVAQNPATAAALPRDPGPRFDAEGRLEAPTDYRTWMFLTSGFAMSYGPAAQAANAGGVDVFDSVFVTPAAYQGFLATGIWPESTMFVLEIRTAEETGSIVTRGRFQTNLVGIEALVKDSKRFEGGFGFFDFEVGADGPSGAAPVIAKTAGCYSCHAKNGAVEHTFTQFYPTLFKVAQQKGTVRADFVGIPPGVDELERRILSGGTAAADKLLAETAAKWPTATAMREATLNQLGYRLLKGKHGPEARAVLESVTKLHPGSTNAWDSLSEILEANGERAAALTAVERGLAALPNDAAAGEDLRQRLDKALRERQSRLR